MRDDFQHLTIGLTSPAVAGEAITPNDSSDVANATRALYVGQTGDVRVQLVSGDIVSLLGMQAGVIYPIRVARVFATGTTATDLVGLY